MNIIAHSFGKSNSIIKKYIINFNIYFIIYLKRVVLGVKSIILCTKTRVKTGVNLGKKEK